MHLGQKMFWVGKALLMREKLYIGCKGFDDVPKKANTFNNLSVLMKFNLFIIIVLTVLCKFIVKSRMLT